MEEPRTRATQERERNRQVSQNHIACPVVCFGLAMMRDEPRPADESAENELGVSRVCAP